VGFFFVLFCFDFQSRDGSNDSRHARQDRHAKFDACRDPLIEVAYNDPAIHLIELGQNSPMHEVVFQSASVPIGTGFVTLQRLLNEHTQGAGAGIVPVALG
jgi:hypothetical protein